MTDTAPNVAEQVSLIYNTVVNLNAVAEDAINFAKQQLAELTNADLSLALGIVDVTIGEDITPSWPVPVSGDLVTVPDEPTQNELGGPFVAVDTNPPEAPQAFVIPPTAPTNPVDQTIDAIVADVTPPGSVTVGALPVETSFVTQEEVDIPVIGEGSEVSIDPIGYVVVSDASIPAVVTPAGVSVGDQPELSVTTPTIPAVVTPVGVSVGDQPELSVTSPTIPDLVVPASISVDTKPTWTADLTGAPDDLADYSYLDLATLDALPEIDAYVPTLDVSILEYDPSKEFSEPTYTARISTEVEAAIKGILGGSLGLPSGYWESIWAQAVGDIAVQAAAKAAENRLLGAASYWPYPSEAVLVDSDRISDESGRMALKTRLEQAHQQAVFAREDFRDAIAKGLAYEEQWIGVHDRIAQRALVASEQFFSTRVAVHNSNIGRFNAALESAKTSGSISDLRVQRLLKKHAQELRLNEVDITKAGHELEAFKSRWQGYQIDKGMQVTALGEQIKFWNGQVDADTRYKALAQAKAKLDLDLMGQEIGAFAESMRAWIGQVDADTKYQGLGQGKAKLELDLMGQEVNAFGEQSRAWNGHVDADTKYQGLGQAKAKLDLDLMSAQLAKLAGYVQRFVAQSEADARYQGMQLGLGELQVKTMGAQLARFAEAMRAWSATVDADTRYVDLDQKRAGLDLQVIQQKIAAFAEDVRYWLGAVGADATYQGMTLDSAKANIQAVAVNAAAANGLAQGINELFKARISGEDLALRGKALQHTIARDTNIFSVDVAKVVQAAQEAKAKIDVAQAQFAQSQSLSLKTNMAQLSYGYAQAAIAASDVSFGRSINSGFTQSASQNEELVW